MKSQRQAKILEIIRAHDVETQEELSERLREAGFAITQATVCRDIRELRIAKVLTAGGRSKYAVTDPESDIKVAAKFRNILTETLAHVDYAGNIVVVKTYSGMANAAAAAIDAMNSGSVVGSLAGDDTIFIVMRTNETAKEFTDEMRLFITK